MKPPAPPFLARRAYRLRRLSDAARFLPVLGAVLFLLPLMWADPASGRAATAPGAVYLFLSWAVLIALTALIARRLDRADPVPDPVPGPEDPP